MHKYLLYTEVLDNICRKKTLQHFLGASAPLPSPLLPMPAGAHVIRSVQMVCKVSQGSVLGPVLLIMYTADLIASIEQHGYCLHLYADDTQVLWLQQTVDHA